MTEEINYMVVYLNGVGNQVSECFQDYSLAIESLECDDKEVNPEVICMIEFSGIGTDQFKAVQYGREDLATMLAEQLEEVEAWEETIRAESDPRNFI
jgi:hypothetical protein